MGKLEVENLDNLDRFASCVTAVMNGCSSVIFVGCPQVTQLVVPALYKLGENPVVLTGKVRTKEGNRVTHIWVELPDRGLRVETNPSQILGWPLSVIVFPMELKAGLYAKGVPIEEWERFPALAMTPAGVAFFDRMSDQVIDCFLGKSLKRKR